jgi:WD40 repeat protein
MAVAGPTRSVQDPQPSQQGFDVFISYSHAADGLLAPALEAGLQSMAKPWYRRRALRVFRDKTSLSATPHLWWTIESALRGSRYFVLLASPLAAVSPWVQRELEWWRDEREPRTLLIALTDGDIHWNRAARDFDWTNTTALPDMLAGFFDDEPLWVDLRPARDEQHLTLRDPRFREGVAELAAPVHNIGKDALIGQDVVQHRRTMRTAQAAVAILIVLAVVATSAGILAVRQAVETARQRDLAEAQARVATSRALAAEAVSLQGEQLDLSLLLAVQANRIEPTAQAREALLGALVGSTDVVDYLRHHTEPVSGLAFAPDGRLLASADTAGDVVLWRVPDGTTQGAVMHVDDESVGALAFSPTGKQLAIAGTGLSLADTTTGEVSGTLDIGDMRVDALAFDGDGSRLAAVGCRFVDDYCDSGLVRVWDIAAQRRVVDTVLDPMFSNSAVAFDPTGTYLAVGGAAGDVTLVDVAGGAPPLRLPEGHPDEVEALSFTGDGQLITASGSSTPVPDDPSGPAIPTVLTWDLATRSVVRPVQLPRISQGAQPLTIALSPRGDKVLTVGDYNQPWLYETTGTPLRNGPLAGRASTVWSADFSPDGSLLATGEENGTVVLWRIGAGGPSDGRLVERRGLQSTWALSVALNPHATTVAVGDGDGVTLLDGATLRQVARVELDMLFGVEALDFGRSDRLLAVAGTDGEPDVLGNLVSGTERVDISLLDVTSGQPVGPPVTVPGYLSDMAVNSRTTTLAVAVSSDEASGSSGQHVLFLDAVTGERTGMLPDQEEPVTTVAYSDDGSLLATGHVGGVVRLWRVEDLRLAATLRSTDQTDVTALAFDPSGRRLAVGISRQSGVVDDDGTWIDRKASHTVDIYELGAEPRLVKKLAGHPARDAASLAFNADGTVLAVGGTSLGGRDGPLGLWDVTTGEPVIAPRTLAGEVTDISVARGVGGFVLVAGSDDGVMVSQLDDESWIDAACDIAGRDLTDDEWAAFVGTASRRPTC